MTSAVHVMLPHSDAPAVRIEDGSALLSGLTVTDSTVVALLATAAQADRPELATRMLTVGAHGMTSMGIGLDLAAIDTRVHDLLDSVTSEAQVSVRSILDESQARSGDALHDKAFTAKKTGSQSLAKVHVHVHTFFGAHKCVFLDDDTFA